MPNGILDVNQTISADIDFQITSICSGCEDQLFACCSKDIYDVKLIGDTVIVNKLFDNISYNSPTFNKISHRSADNQ